MNAINSYKKQMFKPMDNIQVFNLMIDTIKKYLRLKHINKVREILHHLHPENMINNLKRFELTKQQLNFVLHMSDILMFVENKTSQDIDEKDIDRLIGILDDISIPLK